MLRQRILCPGVQRLCPQQQHAESVGVETDLADPWIERHVHGVDADRRLELVGEPFLARPRLLPPEELLGEGPQALLDFAPS